MEVLAPVEVRFAQNRLRMRAGEFIEVGHVIRMGAPGVHHYPGHQQRGVQEISIAYFGTALLHKADLPRYTALSPTDPVSGYVAVSLHQLNIDYKKNGSFAWLKQYTPVERIGKSIDLFYIAP